MYNHQLDTFLKVAELSSFSKAAAELFISPTAVIKQINLLESAIGIKLFVRTHRGISLTAAGRSFYADSKYMINYTRESIQRAQMAGGKLESTLRIGTSFLTPSKDILDFWPRVYTEFPNTKLQLLTFENNPENAREILANLGKNIDIIAGIYDVGLLKHRQCAALKLSDERLCCAVPLNHPLSKKKKLKLTDLENQTLYFIRPGWSSTMDELRTLLQKDHRKIHLHEFQFYDINIFNSCVAENALLLAVKKWENVHSLLKFIPIECDYSMSFGILHNPTPSPLVKNFLNTIKDIRAEKNS